MGRPACEVSGSLQASCGSQLGLPLIEGPERFAAEFKGSGNVQAVESSHAEARTMSAGQFRASLPHGFWQVDLEPEPASQIAFQFGLYPSRLNGSNLFAENMLRDGMHPFRAVKWSEPDSRL